jgi:hypothetical protein
MGEVMSFMFEVYYRSPVDPRKEAKLTEQVASLGGQLTCHEPPDDNYWAVVLTYEFDDWDQAEAAAGVLRTQGEHVEGPMDYGD